MDILEITTRLERLPSIRISPYIGIVSKLFNKALDPGNAIESKLAKEITKLTSIVSPEVVTDFIQTTSVRRMEQVVRELIVIEGELEDIHPDNLQSEYDKELYNSAIYKLRSTKWLVRRELEYQGNTRTIARLKDDNLRTLYGTTDEEVEELLERIKATPSVPAFTIQEYLPVVSRGLADWSRKSRETKKAAFEEQQTKAQYRGPEPDFDKPGILETIDKETIDNIFAIVRQRDVAAIQETVSHVKARISNLDQDSHVSGLSERGRHMLRRVNSMVRSLELELRAYDVVRAESS